MTGASTGTLLELPAAEGSLTDDATAPTPTESALAALPSAPSARTSSCMRRRECDAALNPGKPPRPPPPGGAPAAAYRPTENVKQFYTISGSYLVFTLTDGALRMLVLFQANQVGFTAFQVALMFVLYELLGVVTNLAGGVLGARYGLKAALILGIVLQVVSVSGAPCAQCPPASTLPRLCAVYTAAVAHLLDRAHR